MKAALLAVLCSATTIAYADKGSMTLLLNGQTWIIDNSVTNSATCAKRIDTSIEPSSTKDEYFIAYNDPYNGNSSGCLEVWSITDTYFPRLNEVWSTQVGDNHLTLNVFANEFSGRRLIKTKALQAKLAPSNKLPVLHAQQMDANGTTVESCDYMALSVN